MNESAEYTRLLAQAYSKLADDYVAMTQRVIAAEARVKELESHLASERITREALIQHGLELETRLSSVIKAGDAMAKSAGYVSPPLEWTAARQQGGAE